VGYGNSAPDFHYARLIANKYCTGHHEEIVLSAEMVIEQISTVIQILKTFDPIEIRNSIVSLAAMQYLKKQGYSAVLTGDGSDELFAGYNYLLRYFSNPEQLESELQRLWEIMHFSSCKLGAKLGMIVMSPYLDGEFAKFAKSINVYAKIGRYDNQIWGKFVLRKCFQDALGRGVAWRTKLAQEQGAATSMISLYIGNNLVGDDLFDQGKYDSIKEGVHLRDKEHFYYYSIFRKYFKAPKDDRDPDNEYVCPQCHGSFRSKGRFCRLCGSFPVVAEKAGQ